MKFKIGDIVRPTQNHVDVDLPPDEYVIVDVSDYPVAVYVRNPYCRHVNHREKCGWWHENTFDLVRSEDPVSYDEAMRAVSLPPVEDVRAFFGLTRP